MNLVSARVTATQFISQEGGLTGYRCPTTWSVTSRLWLQHTAQQLAAAIQALAATTATAAGPPPLVPT